MIPSPLLLRSQLDKCLNFIHSILWSCALPVIRRFCNRTVSSKKKTTLYLSTLKVERPTLTNVFQDFLWEKGLWKCHSFKTPSAKFWKKTRHLSFGVCIGQKIVICSICTLVQNTTNQRKQKFMLQRLQLHLVLPDNQIPSRLLQPYRWVTALQQTQQRFLLISI